MLVLRCSSLLGSVQKLSSAAERMDLPVLLLSPSAAKTSRELAFAFYLARHAFECRENLSRKLQNEALLFLARETNFSSAAKKAGATKTGDFLLVSEKNLPPARLKQTLRLRKAKRLFLPKWGKKVGHYSEGELAIESMALSRVKN